MTDGEDYITYLELDKRLGVPNPNGRNLSSILNEAARMCIKHNIPDVTAVVVTKESVEKGNPFPSIDSFNEKGIWPVSGVHIDEVPKIQEKVRNFDWTSMPTLKIEKLK